LRYKQLFDNTLDHIFILEITENKRFKVLAVNPTQEREIGNLRPGAFIEDCLPEDIRLSFNKNYQRCFSEGKIIAYEENFYDRDFYTQLIPIKNAHGNIYRILGIAKEITSEKKLRNQLVNQNEELKALNKDLLEAKEILSESESKFRKLFENSPVGKSMTSLDGQLYVNKAFCKILGYTEEEMKTKKWADITYEGDIGQTEELIQSLLSGKENSVRVEKRYVHKNGSIIWADVSAYLQLDKKSKPQFFIISVVDITEKKKAEEAIKQEGILLRTLINNLSDAIYVKDKEGRKLVANAADMKIMKCSSEADIIGKTDLEIFNSEDGAKGFTEDMEVIKTGKALIDHEDCFVDENGKQHWRLTSKVPLFNEQKQVIGLVGFGRDITERKKNEELLILSKDKAEESDRLKTAFLHNISHEIRTPMNAIVGFSGLLNEPNIVPEKQQYFIDIITQSSNQLLSIITDIINIANIETGQEEISEGVVNIDKLVKNLYEQYLLTAQNQKNSLNLVIPSIKEDLSVIITDETKLTQIISNLLVNALKFTKQGLVNLGYRVTNNEIEFFVEDTGIGIALQMHEEIFKRFRQIEISSSRQYGGSGLGLSISKAYVEMLGGRIWLQSEIGKGSTFYFTIPYKKYEGNIATKEPSSDSSKITDSLVKILLIAEDEESNFMFLNELLSELNFKLIWAKNGLEAVELSKSEAHIDLVLMDIKMPIMNGYEAAKQIKELLPDLPVIALTAYADNEVRERALANGCTDLVGKPFKKEFLLAKIFEHIHKKT
jgi:PAS domain S-box-containing protein